MPGKTTPHPSSPSSHCPPEVTTNLIYNIAWFHPFKTILLEGGSYNIPLYEWSMLFLTVNGCWNCFQFGAVVRSTTKHSRLCLLVNLHVLLETYRRLKFPGHRVKYICSPLLESAKQLFRVVEPADAAISSVWEFQLLQILINTCYDLSFPF